MISMDHNLALENLDIDLLLMLRRVCPACSNTFVSSSLFVGCCTQAIILFSFFCLVIFF